jgi:hypothetical protein
VAGRPADQAAGPRAALPRRCRRPQALTVTAGSGPPRRRR